MSAPESKKNSKTTRDKSSSNTPDTKSASMDPQTQLREIQQLLFGQQVTEVRQTIESLSRDNERQFSEINKLISHSMKELKTQFNSQLDDLTSHVNKLNEDSQNRDSLIEGELSTLQQDFDGFQKQTIAAQDSLESQLFAEAEKLATDMANKYKDVLEKLGNASGDLSERKTDRKALAALFVNMANSLEGESS
tara:strand:+ start:799 stop:1377 length:579 start_codon:yes stop_codon:yes gene_type:complete